MIRHFMKENYKVIIFYIVFTAVLISSILGICQLIPERLRSSTWFVAPNYQSK